MQLSHVFVLQSERHKDKMWSVIVLITLVAYVDADVNVTQCPQSCTCDTTTSKGHQYMNIDCSHVLPSVEERQLSHQLDSMLSADHFVQHLTSLSITNSSLTRVPASVCKLLNLTSLNLNYNRLTELPDNCFTKLTKLVTLSVKWNSIVRLQDGLFGGLQRLVVLDLSYNSIVYIGLRLFSNSSDLIRLRTINLSHNKLTSLEPWWYCRIILGDKSSPVTTDLQHNLISNFTNELNFEYRCGMKRLYGHLNLDHNRIIHIMDMVDGWNIGGNNIYVTFFCMYNHQGSHRYMSVSVATDIYGGSYV